MHRIGTLFACFSCVSFIRTDQVDVFVVLFEVVVFADEFFHLLGVAFQLAQEGLLPFDLPFVKRDGVLEGRDVAFALHVQQQGVAVEKGDPHQEEDKDGHQFVSQKVGGRPFDLRMAVGKGSEGFFRGTHIRIGACGLFRVFFR